MVSAPIIRVGRFHFAARLNTVHFPLDLAEITSILTGAKYRLIQPDLASRDTPPGMRLVPFGQIAESEDGECKFVLAVDRGILAIQGRDIDKIVTDFTKIMNDIRDQFVPELDNKVAFYEFVLEIDAKVGPGRNPIKEIERLHKENKLFEELSRVLNISVTTFGLRLVECGRSPDEARWTEYKIEPDIGKPKTNYFINVIFRVPERDVVIKKATEAISTVQNLLNILGQSRTS